MANVKFSDFVEEISLVSTSYIVGYDSSNSLNTRISFDNFKLGVMNPTDLYIPYNNAGTYADSYLVNDTGNSVLKSVYGGNDLGVKFDFVNNEYQIGSGFTRIVLYDSLNLIESFVNGNLRGFSIDNNTNTHQFGDIGGGCWLSADGNTNIFTVNTQGLTFDDGGSGNLLSNISSGNSGQHLVVTIDGTTYHIKLENP